MTGLIPRPFIDDLLTRTDIVELIDSYVPIKKRGMSYTACCPFHNEKTPSFNVIAKKQFYHCFGCGASGNAISFIMQYLNQGFSDAIETLASRIGLQVPREGKTLQRSRMPDHYDLLGLVARFYQTTLKSASVAIEYLKQRGITGHIAKVFQIGYAPPGWQNLEPHFKKNTPDLLATGMLVPKESGKPYDRYRHRIMFPIHDRHGRVIGFGGRALGDDQKPKYLNSPETNLFQKHRELYGLHHVLKLQKNPELIIVVEGYLDVIALAQHGITHAVATLGTATSTHHIQLLSKHTSKIVFCFDGDAAGRHAAWRALENSFPHLNTGLDIRFIFLPEGYDPDSLVRSQGPAFFNTLLQEATVFHRFFFETLGQTMDCQSLAGKAQLVNAAIPYLQKMSDGPYKLLLMDELAQLTRIEHHRINQLIGDYRPANPSDIKSKPIARSPIRLAIALLLQHPELYSKHATYLDSVTLDGKGQAVLKKLLQHLAQHPEASTATLVELWRESPLFESITRLATWDHKVPQQALVIECIDTVFFLEKQNQENKIRQLLEKSRNEGLNDNDRCQLQDMLKKRHRAIHDEN